MIAIIRGLLLKLLYPFYLFRNVVYFHFELKHVICSPDNIPFTLKKYSYHLQNYLILKDYFKNKFIYVEGLRASLMSRQLECQKLSFSNIQKKPKSVILCQQCHSVEDFAFGRSVSHC